MNTVPKGSKGRPSYCDMRRYNESESRRMELIAERDALRAEVARMKADLLAAQACVNAQAEQFGGLVHDLRAEVERLRAMERAAKANRGQWPRSKTNISIVDADFLIDLITGGLGPDGKPA
jgi:uncharacterized small protein (DUF1192 family)